MIFETDDRVPLTVAAVTQAIGDLRGQGFNPRELRITEDQWQELRQDAERMLGPLIESPHTKPQISGVEIVVEDDGPSYLWPPERLALQEIMTLRYRNLLDSLLGVPEGQIPQRWQRSGLPTASRDNATLYEDGRDD